MERRAILKGITVFTMAFTVLSCEYNVENDEVQADAECETPVLYGETIRPLIDSKCMPCHNGDGSEPFAPNLTTYNGVAGIAGLIKDVTQSRVMPKEGSLTIAEITAIKCWVEDGAMNN